MSFMKRLNTRAQALEIVKPLSKKIHKYPKFIRKPLLQQNHIINVIGFLMNTSFAEDSVSTCDFHSNAESFAMIEEEKPEEMPSHIHKISAVSYVSAMNNKTYSFSCFSDKDFPIPEECRKKIVELSCDDDCMTDDEQISGAIKKLYTSLQDSVVKRNKEIENKA